MYSDQLKKELERADRRARISTVLFILACVAIGLLLVGCSSSRINESYDPKSGALVTRTWSTHQWGTTRQATMSMRQEETPDGRAVYDVATGENVSVDPQTVEIIRLPLDTALGMYGIGQAAQVQRRQIRAETERHRVEHTPTHEEVAP